MNLCWRWGATSVLVSFAVLVASADDGCSPPAAPALHPGAVRTESIDLSALITGGVPKVLHNVPIAAKNPMRPAGGPDEPWR